MNIMTWQIIIITTRTIQKRWSINNSNIRSNFKRLEVFFDHHRIPFMHITTTCSFKQYGSRKTYQRLSINFCKWFEINSPLWLQCILSSFSFHQKPLGDNLDCLAGFDSSKLKRIIFASVCMCIRIISHYYYYCLLLLFIVVIVSLLLLFVSVFVLSYLY